MINAIVETVGAFGEEKSVVTTLDNTSLEGSAEKVSYEMTVKEWGKSSRPLFLPFNAHKDVS